MTDAPPEDLVKAIAEGRCLIVCGAGVSRLATDDKAPGWAQLIEMGLDAARPTGGKDPAWVRACRERLKPDASEKDWLKVADDIQEQLGGSADGRYRAFMKTAVGELRATNRAVIDALTALAAERNPISTTNYDSVLCDEIGCRVICWTNPDGAADCLDGDRKAILHLHGHWDEPGSVIFSARDYERVKGAESAQFLQQLATHTRTLVFVGCSASGLGDENVGSLLKWFGTRWAGRGKKHYVLVPEAGLAVPWPAAVTPISYGNGFGELPNFLAALAPTRARHPTTPSPERAPFPPNPRMIGRVEQLKEVVKHILAGDRPIVVPGGPGMGKTTLALAAAHDKKVKERFGAARVFVDLQAVASAEALLRALASEIGVEISGSTADILAGLSAHAASTLAILDNLETPWHAEPIKIEEMLGQLAGIDGLRLVLTVRGETPRVPGGARKLGDIERLGLAEARELFLRDIDPKFAKDLALPGLLEALDGHPLSIVLMAAQTDGRQELAGLVRDWDKRRATVLARGDAKDRLTSVRVSLGLSVDRLGADAKRLLGVVAMLPTGLQEEDDMALLPDVAAHAASVLVKARLVQSRDGRLTMLAPLRETVREEKLVAYEDEAQLIAHFLAIAADGDKIGTDAWPSVRERVTREAGNLDAICLLALKCTETGKLELDGLKFPFRGLAELHRFGFPVEVASLHRALALPDTDTIELKASCTLSLADIALARADYDTARARYEGARPLYERVGSLHGQANCTLSLGEIALRHSEHATARARFEEAKQLFERAGSLRGQAMCIKSLGDIALHRSDHDTARARFEEAKPLYERVGSLHGQATCTYSLGNIALERSNQHMARIHYEEAKAAFERVGDLIGKASCTFSLGDIAVRCSHYDVARAHLEEAKSISERIGDLTGQANCLQRLGDIALARNNHDIARASYENAKHLYERVGDLLGRGNCIQSLGDIAARRSAHDTARARYEEALALFSKIPEPYSIGFAHLRLMQAARGAAERDRNREAARTAWASIGREDLIAMHLDPPKKGPREKKRSGKKRT